MQHVRVPLSLGDEEVSRRCKDRYRELKQRRKKMNLYSKKMNLYFTSEIRDGLDLFGTPMALKTFHGYIGNDGV